MPIFLASNLSNSSPLREPNSLKKEESYGSFLVIWNFKTVGKRCCQDISPSYQSHWSFLSLSCACLLMTIFAKNWDMWSDRSESLKFDLSWKPGLWPCYMPPSCPSVAHYSQHWSSTFGAPLFPCLPGLMEEKLQEGHSPYTSFFLLRKGSQ